MALTPKALNTMGSLASLGLFLAVAAVLAAPVGAATTPPGPYRTDVQAADYLEHGLKHWAGINVDAANGVTFAFCINGFYSKTEQRTGKHFNGGQAKVNKFGEYMFRSFSCTLVTGGRIFSLYVVTLAKRPFWRVSADR